MIKNSNHQFDISDYIWRKKYRYVDDDVVWDKDIEASWHRVAKALASTELDASTWEQQFYDLLNDFKFLPGGRILANAGTERQATLLNCYVMGTIDDSIDGIFNELKEGAITMQQGGGVGYDFSTLRPSGTDAITVGNIASGPVSFMRIWDSMCVTIQSTGARRGAMMATLRCDHPDIEEFIDVKKDANELRHFNLSVLVSDEFIDAVKRDDNWPLVFPCLYENELTENTIMRHWSGTKEKQICKIHRIVKARELWNKLMRATYDYAEPGVLFIDRINQTNNLNYCEQISATNPCGEVPLPPYGACDLGSINLTNFVSEPFTLNVHFDMEALQAVVPAAVRMLDNVLDVSHYPLPLQQEQAQASRRIGLGITGLADTLLMLSMKYGEKESLEFAKSIMETICHAAYRASIDLAKEKGIFPAFDSKQYLSSPFIKSLPKDIQKGIKQHGIRNSHLIAIAPTGTISLFANNISSGIEPVFDLEYERSIIETGGETKQWHLYDYAYKQWLQLGKQEELPEHFITALDIEPVKHLKMQAVLQPYVDNAISKTINVPEDYSFEEFQTLYEEAYRLGLKGCTTFRPNPVTGSVLGFKATSENASYCCSMDREGD